MLLSFRHVRKKLRGKYQVHHAGTEDAATPEFCFKVRVDLYIYRACLPVRCHECRDGGPPIYSGGL